MCWRVGEEKGGREAMEEELVKRGEEGTINEQRGGRKEKEELVKRGKEGTINELVKRGKKGRKRRRIW